MKNTFLLSLLFVALFSCKKKKSTPSTPSPTPTPTWNWSGTDPMSAMVGSVAFQAESATFFDLGMVQAISGFDSAGNAIAISTNNLTPGEYNLYGSATISASYTTVGGDAYNSSLLTNGKLKIIENDATHVKGLFYFDGKDAITNNTISITKGYFNVDK